MILQKYRLQMLFQNFVTVIENIDMLDRYQLDLVDNTTCLNEFTKYLGISNNYL